MGLAALVFAMYVGVELSLPRPMKEHRHEVSLKGYAARVSCKRTLAVRLTLTPTSVTSLVANATSCPFDGRDAERVCGTAFHTLPFSYAFRLQTASVPSTTPVPQLSAVCVT